ncbi:MAG TPA: hypothetical protein VIY48_17975 [Candidatus Paceibacterota bacterium]
MAALKDERYLDGLLHCVGCVYDSPVSDHIRCNECAYGSLWTPKANAEPFPATVEVLDQGGPEYLRRNGGDK